MENTVYTSYTVPRKLFDPDSKSNSSMLFFLVRTREGNLLLRIYDLEKQNSWNNTWDVGAQWVIDGGRRVSDSEIQNVFKNTHWVQYKPGLPNPYVPPKEEVMPDPVKNTPTSDFKNDVKQGLKLAAANEAGDLAVKVVADLIPGIAPHLEDPAAKCVAKLVGSYVLSNAADMVGPEHAKTVRAVTSLATQAATAELAQMQLKRLTPALEQIIKLGAGLVEV